MSDLQLSLIVIGVVVVGAVYLHNWLQEQRFRHHMQQAFSNARDDVLLKAGVESVLGDGRLEPQLVPQEAVPGAGEQEVAPREARGAVAGFDTVLDYVAEISADTAIADTLIAELMSKIAACGKPVHIAGFDPRSGDWEDVVRGKRGRFTRLRLALQLVNRAGAVNPAQIAAFRDAVEGCAGKIPAPATCPDVQDALQRARDLDAFCAGVDVAIGVNIVVREGASLAGARILALAEGMGFKLESDGVFHLRDDRRQTLLTLDNHEPAPFLPERIKDITTHGVTLLLDVSQVADGVAVLGRMLEIATSLAAALDARLVDDNRVALTEAGIARIREQVSTIHAAMTARGIPAGSVRAQRLFS